MAAKKSIAAKTSAKANARASRADSPAKATAGDATVTIDRRRSGRRAPEAQTAEPVAAAPAPALERRKKVVRRRQIDPTTCERDYSIEEVEFMNAMDDYKRKSGRMFPTCSEVLEVIRGLGYTRLSQTERAMLDAEQTVAARLDSVTEAVDQLVVENTL